MTPPVCQAIRMAVPSSIRDAGHPARRPASPSSAMSLPIPSNEKSSETQIANSAQNTNSSA